MTKQSWIDFCFLHNVESQVMEKAWLMFQHEEKEFRKKVNAIGAYLYRYPNVDHTIKAHELLNLCEATVFVRTVPKKEQLVGNLNFLEIGHDVHGQVVINHRDIPIDQNGVGHFLFSIEQAEELARLLFKRVDMIKAERE